jgi:hypothetical protein
MDSVAALSTVHGIHNTTWSLHSRRELAEPLGAYENADSPRGRGKVCFAFCLNEITRY